MSSRRKSDSQQHIESFMRRAKQRVPLIPTEPTEAECIRVIRVMFEEALEMAKGFGVAIRMKPPTVPPPKQPMLLQVKDMVFERNAKGFKFIEAVDGCIDVRVTATAGLSACGIADEEPQEIIDRSNLAKFGPGHSFREDGKLVKPPDFKAPDIAAAIERQSDEARTSLLASKTKTVKSKARRRSTSKNLKYSQKK